MVFYVIGVVASVFCDLVAEFVHDLLGGGVVLGAVNGVLGDRIAEERPALATPLRLCIHDGLLREHFFDVARDAAASATDRIAVFLHGLCEIDRFWHIGVWCSFGDVCMTYGLLLYEEYGWTLLYLSYNIGWHIFDNGWELVGLLESFVVVWPHLVWELIFVGYSMGGLVARSAVY